MRGGLCITCVLRNFIKKKSSLTARATADNFCSWNFPRKDLDNSIYIKFQIDFDNRGIFFIPKSRFYNGNLYIFFLIRPWVYLTFAKFRDLFILLF